MESNPFWIRIPLSSIIWIMMASLSIGVVYGVDEYCITETLHASCEGKSQVILMEHARYGRMELGRCVARNFGNIGCAKDVLNILDYMCSGRKSCQVSVSDPALVRTQPCPLDFSSYLEVQYRCIEVTQLPREACKQDGRHIESQRVGYLSPLVTKHVRHEKRCPLIIKADPGQRISFTLYDFAFRNQTSPRFSTEQYCQQYFVIREPFVGSDVTICSGDERERPQVYISRTHEVAVELSAKGDQPSFVIKYEVIGCPRLRTPEGTVVLYNDDVIKVSCNNSRESFTLKCVNNTWFGELRNCSTPGKFTNGYDDGEGGTSLVSLPPLGISIVIILGVAMVIVVYVAVMIVCVLYIKKRRRRRTLRENDSSDVIGPEVDRIKMAPTSDRDLQPEEQLPMLTKAAFTCAPGGAGGDCQLDSCQLHELKPCTICNSCSTYMSGQGVPLGRDEGGHYGAAPLPTTAVLTGNGKTLKLSPSKDGLQPNLPQSVRLPASHGSPPARTVTYHIQDRAVDDRRVYAETPYGFPGIYFKTFVKPAAASGLVQDMGTIESGTSPDIVPE